MNNPVALLARRLGIRQAGRTVLAGSIALLSVTAGLGLLVAAPADWAPGLVEQVGLVNGARDLDLDGLPDAAENLAGSDREDPTTLGDVPDGWIHRWYGGAVDWGDPAILDLPVLVPPRDRLPAALRSPDAFALPTLRGLYASEEALRGSGYAWWLVGPALDPLQWDNDGDGIADAWLLHHGLDPLAADGKSPALGDPAMTLQEKYDLGLDPTRADSDRDGLLDTEELRGAARLAGVDLRFKPTDPRAFSTRGDGLADGYIVRFGLDPHDPGVGSTEPAGAGVPVVEAFQATRSHCVRLAKGVACDWRAALDAGQAVDPTRVDTLGFGVPDAWSLRDPVGIAHPLLDPRKTVVFDSKAWDARPLSKAPPSPSAEGTFVDAANPLPAVPFNLTLGNLYAYHRPANWSEEASGPWWHGLPTQWPATAGSLPPAIALRGWRIAVDTQLGRLEGQAASPDAFVWLNASADPRKVDTDGDGLSDWEEYYGVTLNGVAFPRTDPANPDTDADGLTDGEEVGAGAQGTDPARRDTSGSFLTDGQKMDYWTNRALNAPPELRAGLAPDGDLDGDGKTNLLDEDSDGDGLRDGSELFPDRFLDRPSSNARPPTDPAALDTDGDRLPDAWEVDWSYDTAYGCDGDDDCVPPQGADGTRIGWPLDPSKTLSIPGARSATRPGEEAASDADVNLAGDFAFISASTRVSFRNELAYKYDLDPYRPDSDGDGLPDMFSIHWGIEHVPQFAVERAAQDASLAWAFEERGWLHNLAVLERGFEDNLSPITAINPSRTGDPVDAASNLLGIFTGREKGSWVVAPCTPGAPQSLPLSGPRSEAAHPSNPNTGNNLIPGRAGLPALKGDLCWAWVTYPLFQDALRGTNPWSHSSYDDDTLPDAWEAHYGVPSSAGSGTVVPGSAAADCANDLLHVLDHPFDGSADFCILYAEAYRLGLDPRSQDTDGGGLADWVEVKLLGLDPLDPLDDRGQEDWDGDGLINLVEDRLGTSRMNPDSDGDGLLDGDMEGRRYGIENNLPDKDLAFLHATQGDGNLCLADPAAPGFVDGPVRNATGVPVMANRPSAFGGPLSVRQLFEDYIARGVLHSRETGGDCPAGKILFKREGIYDQTQEVVLGAGLTSSILSDTSGDGVPDGWMVFWRDRTSDSRFQDPLRPDRNLFTASPEERDPDSDFVSTAQEYGVVTDLELASGLSGFAWRLPANWNVTRDGTWWAGPDPSRQDTDGDKAWYANLADSDDRVDPDQDNDGIPDVYDAFPAIDHHNEGIIRWNATWTPAAGPAGRYETDYALLWGALEARDRTSYLDPDGDRVPTFLDRFRVAVVIDGVGVGAIEKGHTSLTVTGSVAVAEPPLANAAVPKPIVDAAGDGSAVEGLTVKALVSDGTREALAGFGFTQADGSFSIDATVAAFVQGATTPATGATAAGHVLPPGEDPPPVPTPEALALEPGPLQLRVVAEANDPNLQPLAFRESGQVRSGVAAYKQVSQTSPGETFVVPGGARVKSVLVAPAGDRPDTAQDQRVVHSAVAAFHGASTPHGVTLSASTALAVDLPDAPVLLGEDLAIVGRLLDAAGTPLAGHSVQLRLKDASGATVDIVPPPQTDANGTFHASLDTSDMPPGTVNVTASVQLGAPYLVDPLPASDTSTVSLKGGWGDLKVASRPGLNEGRYPFAKDDPAVHTDEEIPVAARLIDHRGHALAGRTFRITTQTVSGQLVHPPSEATTAPDGWLRFNVPPFPVGVPLSPLQVRWVPAAPMAAEQIPDGLVFIESLQRTRLQVVQEPTTPVGVASQVQVLLQRLDGKPVFDPDARFSFTAAGGTQRLVQGTDEQGIVRLEVNSSRPERVAWRVEYLPAPSGPLALLATPAALEASSTHVGSPELRLQPASGLRGQPVTLLGTLRLPDGTPVSGAVSVGWIGGTNTTAKTDAGGSFSGTLEPQQSEGNQTALARFNGTATLRPAQATVGVALRVPTSLTVQGHNVTFAVEGPPSGPLVTGTLQDDQGVPLADRRLVVRLTRASGNGTSTEVGTDGQGRFTLDAADAFLAEPGAWSARVDYPESILDANASAQAGLWVNHTAVVDLRRVPASMDADATYAVSGRLVTSSGSTGPVFLKATLDGIDLGASVAHPGRPWEIRFQAPAMPNGTRTLLVTGQGAMGVEVHSATAQVLLTSSLSASIRETPRSDGSRLIEVQVVPGPDDSLQGLEVVLLRRGPEGLLEMHLAALDAAGYAQLELAPWQEGSLSILALRDPDVRLGEVTYSSNAVVDVRTERPLWAYILPAGAAAGLAALVAYLVWRRRQVRTLQVLFKEGHDVLMDPRASPAQAIRAIYARMVGCLRNAGYPAKDEETVRDIAARATQGFKLPPQPMQAITRLFELACYSDQELSPLQRDAALDITRSIAQHLGVPLRLPARAPAVPTAAVTKRAW